MNKQREAMHRKFHLIAMFVVVGLSLATFAEEDLKAYYERQLEEVAETFVAPQLGSQVSIRLASGVERTGILLKLDADSIKVMTDNATMDYKRTALHEATRTKFFADDYAKAEALERTRAYKEKLQAENMAEYYADLHEGRISVNAKVDKDSDKNVERDERELKNGETLTTTTTTRTYTEIQNLKVTVANNTTHPDTYSLVWAFFGNSVESDTISMHDNGKRSVTVPSRQRELVEIASEPFVVEKATINAENSGSSQSSDPRQTESGTEVAGWLVVLKYGNEILDIQSSSKTFETDEWINRL